MNYYDFALQIAVLCLLWISLQLWHYLPQLTKRIKKELKAFYEDADAIEHTMRTAHNALVKRLHADMEDLIESTILHRIDRLEAKLPGEVEIDYTAISEPIRESIINSLNGWWGNQVKAAEKGMEQIEQATVEQAEARLDPMQVIIAKIAKKDETMAAILAMMMQGNQGSPGGDMMPRPASRGRY